MKPSSKACNHARTAITQKPEAWFELYACIEHKPLWILITNYSFKKQTKRGPLLRGLEMWRFNSFWQYRRGLITDLY